MIDGSVNGIARLVGWFGNSLCYLQTGYVRNYAFYIVIGCIFVIAAWAMLEYASIRNSKWWKGVGV